MPFQKVERVIYNKNPLDNVICQLRFPPILTIDSEIPASFQNAIRDEFPAYKETLEFQQEISSGLQLNGQSEIVNPLSNIILNKNHSFESEDGVWKINLTRTFLSISTSKYTRWEEFKGMFQKPLLALKQFYNPPFFTRLGLRYVNIFCRSKLDLKDIQWSELIHQQFLGILASEVKDSVNEFTSACEIRLADEISSVRIITALVQNLELEKCFMIDNDFYTPSKIKFEDVDEKLDFINERSTRLIKYIVKPKLHDAMEARKI